MAKGPKPGTEESKPRNIDRQRDASVAVDRPDQIALAEQRSMETFISTSRANRRNVMRKFETLQ